MAQKKDSIANVAHQIIRVLHAYEILEDAISEKSMETFVISAMYVENVAADPPG